MNKHTKRENCKICKGNKRVHDKGIWTKICPDCRGTGKSKIKNKCDYINNYDTNCTCSKYDINTKEPDISFDRVIRGIVNELKIQGKMSATLDMENVGIYDGCNIRVIVTLKEGK